MNSSTDTRPPEVEVIITPTTAQYQQLVADLRLLKQAGGESNTGIIIDAVSEKAERVRASGNHLRRAA